MLELVLQGCNGDIVRAIEHCLAVDDSRVDSKSVQRPSYRSSESSSSASQLSLNPTTPTSPAEFFKNLTAPSRPFQGLPTFQPYMVSNRISVYSTQKIPGENSTAIAYRL